ncbi:type II toxin-antitoxin system RelE family toxin [Fastidiosibacter lacustris]|uniref:type II toxin-antitoxin system RelE family toxin n=1 Tax=Fastidiosibacter lacustris TaxID=2056695 RepID=UPI001EFEE337|nr:type II toxin-antitoxin system RelE/ParE family toxin [Fastidiosibacter lacustris]
MFEVKFTKQAIKDLKKIDKTVLVRIKGYINELKHNPREKGKQLSGNLHGLWRYRIGKYRIIVEIKDNELILLVVKVSKRENVYN